MNTPSAAGSTSSGDATETGRENGIGSVDGGFTEIWLGWQLDLAEWGIQMPDLLPINAYQG